MSDSQLVISHVVAPCRTAALNAPAPKPAPCTLTLAEPVAAAFTRLSTLVPPISSDTPTVTLPMRPPTLTATTRLCPLPVPPPRHTNDVSDAHTVPSHDDPTRVTALHSKTPSRPPHIVTLADPVAAPFPRSTTLAVPASTEYASDKLPTPAPTLRRTLQLPDTPCPFLHPTLVSDSQPVRSHPVPPTRTESECDASPKPPPTSVTLVDPLAAALSLLPKLIGPSSIESILDPVPTASPKLNDTRRLPTDPCPIKHPADESDTHIVASQAVRHVRPAPVHPDRPTLHPCTVTLSDPDDPAFQRLIVLAPTKSPENKPDALPLRIPELTLTRMLPAPDCAPLHRTPVSDSHVVLSHVDMPIPTLAEYAAIPSPAPYSVTLDDPDAAPFFLEEALTRPNAVENRAVTLPARAPELKTNARVLPTPCPALHTTALSADHVLCSHSVRPARTPPVNPASPAPLPCTVTLAAPDDAWFACLAALNALAPPLNAHEPLPTLTNTETTVLLLPAIVCPALPSKDVSDTHTLPSAALCPTRAPTE